MKAAPIIRVISLAAMAIVILLLGAGPAAAHVTVDTVEPADGAATITFSFNHACDDSPTTALETRLPAGATGRAVTPPADWRGQIDGDTVTMTGPPIPGDRQVEYTITVELTGQIGRALLFPTVQTCADGEMLNWTNPDETADDPAPRLIATAAVLTHITQQQGSVVGADEGASMVAVAVSIAVFIILAAGLGYLHQRRAAR